jgi:WD40 repeat protein
VSGCGKSSLIEAGLRPKLLENRLSALPTIRMARRHVDCPTSLIATVMATLAPALGVPARSLTVSSGSSVVPDNLDDLLRTDRQPVENDEGSRCFDLLIFDQFEEVFDSARVTEENRIAFFRQVGIALKDKTRWALFAIREDYLGALEPYLRFLPTYLSTRFRLTQLPVTEAEKVILSLTVHSAVPFEPKAAELLAQELSEAGAAGNRNTPKSELVEPVHLQVAGSYLWEICRERGRVTTDDIGLARQGVPSVPQSSRHDEAPVDRALGRFYATQLCELFPQGQVEANKSHDPVSTERIVREWFEDELIADRSLRRQVQRGPALESLQSAYVLKELENRYLIRRDSRMGPVWFELSHDRLIAPILADNNEWFDANLEHFQRVAREWKLKGKPQALYIGGSDLSVAQEWVRTHPTSPLQYDRDFVQHSRMRSRYARNKVLSRVFMIATALVALALVAVTFDRGSANRRERSGRLALAAMSSLASDPERSLLLGLEAAYELDEDSFTPEVQGALNAALQASRLMLRDELKNVPYGLAFSRESSEFVTVDVAGKLRRTDVFTGQTTDLTFGSLQRDRAGLSGVPFTFWGRYIAAAGDDNSVRVIDIGGTEPIEQGTPAPTEGNVYSIDIDATNNQLAIGTSSGVYLWDLRERTLLSRQAGGSIAVAFNRFNPNLGSGSASFIVTAGTDGWVRLWDSGLQKQLFRLNTDSMSLTSVDISPDGQYVAIGAATGQLLVWAPRQKIVGIIAQLPTSVNVVKYSPNARVLAVGEGSGDVTLFQAPRRQIRNLDPQLDQHADARDVDYASEPPQIVDRIAVLRGHTRAVRSLDFSGDSRLIATASEDKTARIWDAAYPAGGSAVLASAISDDSKVTVRLTESLGPGGAALQQITTSQGLEMDCTLCSAVALSGDGRRLAVAGAEGVRLVTTTSGQTIPLTKPMNEAHTYDIALSNDGKILAMNGTSGLRLWNIDDQRRLPTTSKDYVFTRAPATAPARSIAVRSWNEKSGTRGRHIELAAGYEDGSIVVWHLRDEALVESEPPIMLKSPHSITSLAFGKGPRERELASVDSNGLIIRWNLTLASSPSREIERYVGPSTVFGGRYVDAPRTYEAESRELAVGGIWSGSLLAYDAAGERLAAGSLDGLRVYNVTGAAPSQTISGRPTIAVGFSSESGDMGKTLSVVSIDIEGDRYVSWLSDSLLARQVQEKLTRSLTPAECASYMSSLGRDCAANNRAFEHVLAAQAHARAGRIDHARVEFNQVGRYRRYSGYSAASDWLVSLAANAERKKAAAARDPRETVAASVRAYKLWPHDDTALEIVSGGERLANRGYIESAVEAYQRAVELRPNLFASDEFDPDSDSARAVFRYLNNLCWYGAEYGRVQRVLTYCDAAVQMESKPGLARDNRAVARARAMLLSEAIADLDAYLDSNKEAERSEERRKWRSCLVASMSKPAVLPAEVHSCTNVLIYDLTGAHPRSAPSGGISVQAQR